MTWNAEIICQMLTINGGWASGDYNKAVDNFCQALNLQDNPKSKGSILCNLALCCTHRIYLRFFRILCVSTGRRSSVIRSLEQCRNDVSCTRNLCKSRKGIWNRSDFFSKAASACRIAVAIALNSYFVSKNWLKINMFR